MIQLDNEAAWEQAVQVSHEQPVLVFKHSTRCPISSMAYSRMSAYLTAQGEKAPVFYLVLVVESRSLSNTIASSLGVEHQSPQLILIRQGKAVWDASHGDITGEGVQRALRDCG